MTKAVVRAGLAALTESKGDTETVLQVILGRAYAPSPVPNNLSDPHASWLSVILGDVEKASAESRKTVKEKVEQQDFPDYSANWICWKRSRQALSKYYQCP